MDAPREGRDDERTVVRAIRDQANVEGGVMAVREQPITDGVPVFEVDTAEELKSTPRAGRVRARAARRAGRVRVDRHRELRYPGDRGRGRLAR